MSKIMGLSKDEVLNMIRERGFNHPNKAFLFPSIEGHFQHNFTKIGENSNNAVVIDTKTGLMWQQSGSPSQISWQEAPEYITRSLNNKNYGGYADWRLPTIEELASLLSSEKMNDSYIYQEFDQAPKTCWSSTSVKDSQDIWIISFSSGYVFNGDRNTHRYIRAVRTNHQ